MAHGASELIGRHLAYQLQLIADFTTGNGEPGRGAAHEWFCPSSHYRHQTITRRGLTGRSAWSSRSDRSVRVLGPDFAEIDRFPTRVRLPDEPLMLVDRIVSIEGQPRRSRVGEWSPSM